MLLELPSENPVDKARVAAALALSGQTKAQVQQCFHVYTDTHHTDIVHVRTMHLGSHHCILTASAPLVKHNLIE